jgi:hypothetical protein
MAQFPGPNYNRIIESDPQIVKIPLDNMMWGSRPSAMPKGGEAPSAPEMTIKHVDSMKAR